MFPILFCSLDGFRDIAHGKEAHKILKFDRDDIPYESKSFKYIRKNEVHKMRNAEEKELVG